MKTRDSVYSQVKQGFIKGNHLDQTSFKNLQTGTETTEFLEFKVFEWCRLLSWQAEPCWRWECGRWWRRATTSACSTPTCTRPPPTSWLQPGSSWSWPGWWAAAPCWGRPRVFWLWWEQPGLCFFFFSLVTGVDSMLSKCKAGIAVTAAF